MPTRFKSILQPHPKRGVHSQSITGRIYVSIHILLGVHNSSLNQTLGPKRDEKGVEDFEDAFKELSLYVLMLHRTIKA